MAPATVTTSWHTTRGSLTRSVQIDIHLASAENAEIRKRVHIDDGRGPARNWNQAFRLKGTKLAGKTRGQPWQSHQTLYAWRNVLEEIENAMQDIADLGGTGIKEHRKKGLVRANLQINSSTNAANFNYRVGPLLQTPTPWPIQDKSP